MLTPESSVSLASLGAKRADQLARIAEAGLMQQGRVFLLSLDAIRLELGPRWEGRHELIWDTLSRALTKRMPPPDVFVRINDATVLAAIVSVDPYSGQVRCAEVLRSTLAYFLGREAEGDLGMARVSSMSGDSLSCERIDLTAPPPPAPPAARVAGRSPDRWTPPLAGRRLAASFVSERAGLTEMCFDVVPVWRLDQGIVSAYAIRRRLPARLETYTDLDREIMGHRLLDQLLPLLEEYRREGGVFALIISGSFSSASTRRPRLDLLDRCTPVLDVMRQAVIMELEGFGPGIPAGRIRETAAMMTPFFRVLTASVRCPAEADVVVRDYAFQGMAIDASGLSDARIEQTVRSVRRCTGNVVVHAVRPDADEAWLRRLGVSHVTYRLEAGRAAVRPGGSVPDGVAIRLPGPVPESRESRAGG